MSKNLYQIVVVLMRLFGLYLVIKGVLAGVVGMFVIHRADLFSSSPLYLTIAAGVLVWLAAKPVAEVVTKDIDPE
ncbi:MAG: hypothetical protein KDN05_19445 [Verrucomicrobiae bacterium]|nr:hypothetical protein [Verrucomicrobiae bacterium]